MQDFTHMYVRRAIKDNFLGSLVKYESLVSKQSSCLLLSNFFNLLLSLENTLLEDLVISYLHQKFHER